MVLDKGERHCGRKHGRQGRVSFRLLLSGLLCPYTGRETRTLGVSCQVCCKRWQWQCDCMSGGCRVAACGLT